MLKEAEDQVSQRARIGAAKPTWIPVLPTKATGVAGSVPDPCLLPGGSMGLCSCHVAARLPSDWGPHAVCTMCCPGARDAGGLRGDKSGSRARARATLSPPVCTNPPPTICCRWLI